MQKTILTVMAAGLLLTTLTGCLKWYCCGNLTYNYKCDKGANAVYVEVTGAPNQVQANITDSINFYRTQGYVCGIVDTIGPYLNCIQGDARKKKAEAGGQVCAGAEQNICSEGLDEPCTDE